MKKLPIVMTFSGHDPSGGAGIQADIETLSSQGCLATPIITALTVQDSRNVTEFKPIEAGHITSQARAVLGDMPVAAFKIGMIGSADNAQAIHSILQDYPDTPLVLDPVLASGGGTQLGDEQLRHAIRDLLLPHTTVLTPNSVEARLLAPEAYGILGTATAVLTTLEWLSDLGVQRDVVRLGAERWVNKPFDIKQFVELVNETIRQMGG